MIAAITSCTNTSNPSVMMAAGLIARKAVEKGLSTQALGEDFLAPGSQGGHRLSRQGRSGGRPRRSGFNLVGYGCTTCIGNSGPLPERFQSHRRW
ncbi:aconitase family protein [Marinobacter salsuginis]|uniref:aconitase family protein n=1 Tax=Marinobacter salsuginis TaxID=418719 RepID=UPI001D18BC77|nr:aconitase family protein [Marinobacter salsuginis]